MKRKMIVPALLAVVMLAVGSCTTTVTRPLPDYSGFPPAGTFNVLGRVTISYNKAGQRGKDKNGLYMSLLKAAKEKYRSADDVVHILIDSNLSESTFGGSSGAYVATGIAISYK